MKLLKRFLCIFLAVIILFFSVNNSYFSPHKMDEVEASVIVASACVITVDMVIQLLCAIAVTGLSCALIDEMTDLNWEAVLDDLHTWCRENYEAISDYLVAQPAIKTWIDSDTWVVVTDIPAGGSPLPSPSPDDEEEPELENPPAQRLENTGLSAEEYEALLNEHHGFSNAFRMVAVAAAGGVTLSSVLAPLSFVEKYNHWVDSEGNVIPDDDPRVKPYTMDDPAIAGLVHAYFNDKVTNFKTAVTTPGVDPITDALQYRYGTGDDSKPYYNGNYTMVDDKYSYSMYAVRTFNSGSKTIYKTDSPYSTTDKYAGSLTSSGWLYTYTILEPSGAILEAGARLKEYVYQADGSLYITRDSEGSPIFADTYSCNYPIFSTQQECEAFLRGEIDDSACINRVRPNNYIDTNDDYGWASTADLSPSDLAQAAPDVIGSLNGKDVSIPSLIAAINSLKAQLEEQNPNVDSEGNPVTNPVPYPDVPTYTDTVKDVITNPDTFPDSSVNPNPEPGTDPDPDTGTDAGKDYTGLLGLIINLLKSILQAIKDFMSWFVIDFDAIKAHLLLALGGLPVLAGYDTLLGIVNDFRGQITDNYDYPKITMQTPDVLLPFLKKPEIVIIDFADYAELFIWVRTIMGFAIIFGSLIYIIKEIKVEFTLN